jgi:hypothetical protein
MFALRPARNALAASTRLLRCAPLGIFNRQLSTRPLCEPSAFDFQLKLPTFNSELPTRRPGANSRRMRTYTNREPKTFKMNTCEKIRGVWRCMFQLQHAPSRVRSAQLALRTILRGRTLCRETLPREPLRFGIRSRSCFRERGNSGGVPRCLPAFRECGIHRTPETGANTQVAQNEHLRKKGGGVGCRISQVLLQNRHGSETLAALLTTLAHSLVARGHGAVCRPGGFSPSTKSSASGSAVRTRPAFRGVGVEGRGVPLCAVVARVEVQRRARMRGNRGPLPGGGK